MKKSEVGGRRSEVGAQATGGALTGGTHGGVTTKDAKGAKVRATADAVNCPPHYKFSFLEPIDVIEAWELGFCLGNALKYIARAEHKGTPIEDLEKARWYLSREITRRKEAK